MIFKSLITKTIISTTLILFLAVGISWWIHMGIYEAQLMDTVRGKVRNVLVTAENSISKSMRIGKTNDTNSILELVNSHMEEDSVVRIFHPNGVIIKSTSIKEIGKMVDIRILDTFLKGKREVILVNDNGERMLNMLKPIRNIRECHMCHGAKANSIGVLNAEISLLPTDTKLDEARTLSNISAIIISMILSFSISFLLYWMVIKPISKLSRKMSLAAKGDLTVKSGLKKGDEVGQLGRSFDFMVEKLHQARIELEKYHYQQLERVDRLASVGELASGIAHEIKNPLAGIAGAVQVLAREFKGDRNKEKIVKEILQQIARLDKSVKDLLNYASPSMPEFAQENLNAIIDKALFFVTQQPKAKGIKVVRNFDDNLPRARVDDKQMQQVLLNLFLNAINAMEGEGVLKITSSLSEEGSIIIDVEDNGRGIAEEDIPRLFTPFFTTREEGTGLGLSISKRIIEQHGGKITVTSKVGEGTRVRLTLPVDSPEERKVPKDEQKQDTRS